MAIMCISIDQARLNPKVTNLIRANSILGPNADRRPGDT